ncbi:unnamed protein product [marine sediment metagenome]|uniref:Carboxypeptidase regulatory-like domain-containing protein n=1 Tax=marine sediment metagenome TaxID=412755 RepID=X0UZT8_9ZZZZ
MILFGLLAAGCGSADGLARVKGTVTLKGQPLEGAVVDFRPLAPGGSPSSGITDAEGRYLLMYNFSTAGAMQGEHVVSIRTARTIFDDQGIEHESEECVPANYNTHTQLKRTVEAGRNTIDFDL